MIYMLISIILNYRLWDIFSIHLHVRNGSAIIYLTHTSTLHVHMSQLMFIDMFIVALEQVLIVIDFYAQKVSKSPINRP